MDVTDVISLIGSPEVFGDDTIHCKGEKVYAEFDPNSLAIWYAGNAENDDLNNYLHHEFIHFSTYAPSCHSLKRLSRIWQTWMGAGFHQLTDIACSRDILEVVAVGTHELHGHEDPNLAIVLRSEDLRRFKRVCLRLCELFKYHWPQLYKMNITGIAHVVGGLVIDAVSAKGDLRCFEALRLLDEVIEDKGADLISQLPLEAGFGHLHVRRELGRALHDEQDEIFFQLAATAERLGSILMFVVVATLKSVPIGIVSRYIGLLINNLSLSSYTQVFSVDFDKNEINQTMSPYNSLADRQAEQEIKLSLSQHPSDCSLSNILRRFETVAFDQTFGSETIRRSEERSYDNNVKAALGSAIKSLLELWVDVDFNDDDLSYDMQFFGHVLVNDFGFAELLKGNGRMSNQSVQDLAVEAGRLTIDAGFLHWETVTKGLFNRLGKLAENNKK